MTLVGSGAFTYAVQQDWFELPEGWSFGWVPAVACDSEIASMCTAAASIP